MSKSKVVSRIVQLDRLLRNYCVSMSTLMYVFSVSKATMKRDIKLLRKFNPRNPVMYDPLYGYYYKSCRTKTILGKEKAKRILLENSNTNTKNKPQSSSKQKQYMSAEELCVVHQAWSQLQHLSQKAGPFATDFANEAHNLGMLLRQTLGVQKDEPIEDFLHSHLPVVYDQDVIDPAVMKNIYDAIRQKTCLGFTYFKNSQNTQSHRIVTPIRLMHNGQRWYLDAYCHMHRSYRRFALDCMSEPYLDYQYKPHPVVQQDAREYFDAGVGADVGRTGQLCYIRFSEVASRYIYACKIHPAQQMRIVLDQPGKIDLYFPYTPGMELMSFLLQWLGECRVIAPLELRRALKMKITQGRLLHEGSYRVESKKRKFNNL